MRTDVGVVKEKTYLGTLFCKRHQGMDKTTGVHNEVTFVIIIPDIDQITDVLGPSPKIPK